MQKDFSTQGNPPFWVERLAEHGRVAPTMKIAQGE
jgi:hypothetical protein